MPTGAELERAEKAYPGSAKRLLDTYVAAGQAYLQLQVREFEKAESDAAKLWTYRWANIVCGMDLGVSSLGVIAFAVAREASLAPLAAALTPVAGIAGVFVWGYAPVRPKADGTAKSSAAGRSERGQPARRRPRPEVPGEKDSA